MPSSSLLALIDDIASTLDDVAVLTKLAAKKTTGVLGDDLALNAQQVSGVHADRELPVVFAVAKGSIINKAILVPTALAISKFVPWLVTPALMAGGLFLCFEGFEKVFEKLFLNNHKAKQEDIAEVENIESFEKEKIKGAIRTDFILSAEIIVITLGTVVSEPVSKQFLVLSTIALLMTIGVYGLVAAIVKLDDLGFYLIKSNMSQKKQQLGRLVLAFAPQLMKFLGIAGTIAMFLVGGGIIVHGIPFLHHLQEDLAPITSIGFDLVMGVVAGFLVFLIIEGLHKIKHKKQN